MYLHKMTLFTVVCIFCSLQRSNSQLLSAYEQAYGPWKIRLTRRSLFGKKWYMEQFAEGNDTFHPPSKNRKRNSDLQLLFPLNPERIEQPTGTNQRSLFQKAIRSIPCILVLETIGKFIIRIDDGTLQEDLSTDSSEVPSIRHSDTDRTTTDSNLHNSLQGEWFLTPNPYCVTDRQYDTVTLIAEPRIRRAHSPEGILTEMAQIELRCKLWGRYGVGAVRHKLGFRHGREMGRMTHGTVLVVREYKQENRWSRETKTITKRDVLATFAGQGMLDTNESDSRDEESEPDTDVLEEEYF